MNAKSPCIMKDIIGYAAFAVLVVVLFWLYLAATPDQMSAECEALRAEMEMEGK